jgi:hypothetical protein
MFFSFLISWFNMNYFQLLVIFRWLKAIFAKKTFTFVLLDCQLSHDGYLFWTWWCAQFESIFRFSNTLFWTVSSTWFYSLSWFNSTRSSQFHSDLPSANIQLLSLMTVFSFFFDLNSHNKKQNIACI